ncbi:hypothetical protein QFZ54_003183 [Sphingomonas faeni]|nr:hypothetical protein [Sphingomonas faeni]
MSVKETSAEPYQSLVADLHAIVINVAISGPLGLNRAKVAVNEAFNAQDARELRMSNREAGA